MNVPLITYTHIPSDEETADVLLNMFTRRIFCVEIENYSLEEKKRLLELYEFLKLKSFQIPTTYKYFDLFKQYQGQNFDLEKTFVEVIKELCFKCEKLPVLLNDKIKEILNKGFIYVHGRDNRYRPLIFIKPSKYKELTDYSNEECKDSIVFFIEFLIHKCLIPGVVESWNIILDVEGISVMDIAKLKEVFGIIKGIYRCRLYKLYLVNLNAFFTIIWNIAKNFMGSTLDAKAVKVDSKEGTYPLLFDRINKGQVEKKYGGESENLTEGFFPPKFKNGHFYASNDGKASEICLNNEIDFIKENGEIYYEVTEDYD